MKTKKIQEREIKHAQKPKIEKETPDQMKLKGKNLEIPMSIKRSPKIGDIIKYGYFNMLY